MRIASANVRPFCDSNSTASSRLVESVPPCVKTGLHSTGSVESRAAIRARLPHTVLISPLCPSVRSGCARCHVGSVFVAYL